MSVVLFLVAGCTGASSNSTSGVSTAATSTSTAETAGAALGATPLWSQSETVAPGLVLDPLGPIDPGVAVEVEMLPPTLAVTLGGLEGVRIGVDSCRTVAPGRWVIEGSVAVPDDETVSGVLGVEVGASDTFNTEYLGVTFAGSGTFALGFERPALSTGKLDNGALWWGNEVSLTNCQLVTATTAGRFVTIEHFEDLPGWEASDGTVQSYALDVANSSRGGLGWSLGVDVWLGVAYPFGELWLPDDPTLFGPIGSSNQPGCASTAYSMIVGDVRVADVTHFAGSCHGDPATLGAVEGAAGWEWVEAWGTAVTARRSLNDGGLEVRAADRDMALQVIDDLHPYRNLLVGEPVGASTLDEAVETAMAAQLEGGDSFRDLVERGRVPIESGVVVVLTGVTVRSCDGCTARVVCVGRA